MFHMATWQLFLQLRKAGPPALEVAALQSLIQFPWLDIGIFGGGGGGRGGGVVKAK